jgi:hypothetical protein
MTAGDLPERDRPAPEALLADRYLDDLLAAAERGADAAPADAALDPGLRDAAEVLRRSLIRIHPSFRFEERLSVRLAAMAAAGARPVAATSGAAVLPWDRASLAAFDPVDVDPLLASILAGDLDPADAAAVDAAARPALLPRPLLVGGAITSAAISLVGVAWVAWRASRPGLRAALVPSGRGAPDRRLADPVSAVGGIGGPA